MRELEILFAKAEGALWESEFNLMSAAAVEVQLGVFFLLQVVFFIIIKGVLIGFVKNGLKWGDH